MLIQLINLIHLEVGSLLVLHFLEGEVEKEVEEDLMDSICGL